MTEIWQLPATALARKIREKEISSREVVSSLLSRIDRLNPAVNAFALIDREQAIADAEKADTATIRGDVLGPLHGLPVTVKDLLPTRGLRTAYGSRAFADNIPDQDTEAVARVRAAGGIVLGKTTTPELGHKVMTDSPLHGLTRNPWALERSPGGSSGGAAAAVAMGFGPLAVATDGAGSGRIPASCCGVVGLKPTVGAIPHETTTDLFGSLSVIGPMTRTVGDLALLFNVMAGPDARDPWSYGGSFSPLTLAEDPVAVLKGLRIRWMPRTINSYLDPDTERLTTAVVNRLCDNGAEVVDGPEITDWGLDIGGALMRAYQTYRYGDLLEEWRDKMDPTVVAILDGGRVQEIAALRAALSRRTDLFRRVQSLFDHCDVLITPTVSTPTVPVTQKADQPLVIDGTPLGTLRETWYCYTIPFNPSGNPAISVPCGLSKDGLPVGLQIVAPWHAEQRLVAIAAAIESISPWQNLWPALAHEETVS